jgi:hypothetical protein
VCQACLERLQNGQSLGIFPEGTRNHDPHRLKRGRRGVGEIALRSGVPVLPAGLDFTRRSRNGRIPWFSPVILRFGAPLTFPEEAQAFRRTILGRPPFYRHARHIIQNERQVTRIVGTYKGERFPYYVVQIAGRSVNGIDSFVQPGEEVDKGSIFGIIRIGSQVDLVVPHLPDLKIKTRPGARVRAGETILVA